MNKIIAEDISNILNTEVLSWNDFSGKTILITGASGFLASYLVYVLMELNLKKLISEPVTIIALVRNLQKAENKFADYLPYETFKLVEADVCEPVEFSQDIHYIIHAASQASPKYYGADPIGTLASNIFGTVNMLKLAEENPIESFLYFSSGEVYGETEKLYVSEQDYGIIDPMRVRSCYAESKRMGENICVSWHQQYNIPVKIVRPFHTYGPGMNLDDGRVFCDFVADIISNRDIDIKSDGSAERAFCYLADATIAFFAVLLKGNNAEAYNVGNANATVSVLELAKILVDLYPEKNLKILPNSQQLRDGYLKSPIKRNSPNIEKLKQLGWSPVTGISQGFSRSVTSFVS